MSHFLKLRVLNEHSKHKKAMLFLVALLWHKWSLILHFACGTTVEDVEIVLSLSSPHFFPSSQWNGWETLQGDGWNEYEFHEGLTWMEPGFSRTTVAWLLAGCVSFWSSSEIRTWESNRDFSGDQEEEERSVDAHHVPAVLILIAYFLFPHYLVITS